MRIPVSALACASLLSACGGERATSDNASAPPAEAPVTAKAPAVAEPAAAAAQSARWDLQSSGEGAALLLLGASGKPAIRLFCPARQGRLLVNVPSFRPIGSEERLSFGSGGEAVTLVADARGDRGRGGVSGTGPVPAELGSIVRGPISASYGPQTSGPHPAPPAELARGFLAACGEKRAAAPAPASPCLTQDGKPLEAKALRALGTEPFWGARIEGRCVTYSHPDDQKGTRVWTRFTAGAGGGGTWSGALGGKAFDLRIRPQPGCSDGMSDNRYPMAADLLVGGERRRGCAKPV
jgi:uncharacterized membrane protein